MKKHKKEMTSQNGAATASASVAVARDDGAAADDDDDSYVADVADDTDDDHGYKWIYHGPHVGERLDRFVWKDSGLLPVSGTIVAQTPAMGRRPALYLWQSFTAATAATTTTKLPSPTQDLENDDTAAALDDAKVDANVDANADDDVDANVDANVDDDVDVDDLHHLQVLTHGEMITHSTSMDPPPSVYNTSHITNAIQQRLEHNLHSYTVQNVLPDCFLHALLEEAWMRFLEEKTKTLTMATSAAGGSTNNDNLATNIPSRPMYYSSAYVAPPTTTTTTTTTSNNSSLLDHNYKMSTTTAKYSSNMHTNTNCYYSVSSIHQRIKAGAALAYHHWNQQQQQQQNQDYSNTKDTQYLRRSRRSTTTTTTTTSKTTASLPHVLQKGGKVALYLLEHLKPNTNQQAAESTQGTPHDPPNDNNAVENKDGTILASTATTGSSNVIRRGGDDGDESNPRKEEEEETNDNQEQVEKDNHVSDTISNRMEEIDSSHPNNDNPQAEQQQSLEKNDSVTDMKDTSKKDLTDCDLDKRSKTGDGNIKHEVKKESNGASTTTTKGNVIKDGSTAVVLLINAHEEEIESEDDDDDDADQDADFDTNDEIEAEEEEDDILKDVVKEQPQLDIDMEVGVVVDPKNEKGEERDNDDDDDDDEDGDYVSQNPRLQPTQESLLEWMGRRGKSLGVAEIQEAVGYCLKSNLGLYDLSAVDQRALGAKGETFVLESNGEKWKDIKRYDPATFSRCKFRLKSDREDEDVWSRLQEREEIYRRERAWTTWRFKGIHGGFTVWPLWKDSVKEVLGEKKKEASPGESSIRCDDETGNDEALAQTLALESASSRRSARRGNTKEGVFYGTQSQMSQKQLGETIVRICKQSSLLTLMGLKALVGDDSSNPVHRLRTALGRVLWKRNQISRCQVTSVWSDHHLWKTLKTAPLCSTDEDEHPDAEVAACLRVLTEYIRQLHQTELQLRNMILRALTSTPPVVIATAADERSGTLESFDASDFEDPSSIEWSDKGHASIGKRIFRPPVQPAFEGGECKWFQIQDFVDSVPYEGPVDDKNEKGAALAERRMRFRAFPVDMDGNVLILTEAQVAAGIQAAEKRSVILDSKSGKSEHPFTGGIGTTISLKSSTSAIECFVVGFDTIIAEEDQLAPDKFVHLALILPQATKHNDAFWTRITADDNGNLHCSHQENSEVRIYKLEQPDYGETSKAYKACHTIICFLENHKHADIFMEPVDPIALNIPTYFDIIKRPMDITTLSENLEKGVYSKIPSSKSKGRSSVSRMLNGPFGDDALLIFDNAVTFNPPDNQVHQTAKSIRKALLKKIEQLSLGGDVDETGRRGTQKNSVYIDEDSDVDMYEYESDHDDEDFGSGRRSRKRARKSGIIKDDISLKTIEAPIRLQKTLSETLGLRAPFANLPILGDAEKFSLRQEWSCRHQHEKEEKRLIKDEDQAQIELQDMITLQMLADERERANTRRSTRVPVPEDTRSKCGPAKASNVKVSYHLGNDLPRIPSMQDAPSMIATSRVAVEILLEHVHETYYAKLYHQFSKTLKSDTGAGVFSNVSFPPYLGRVVSCCLDGKEPTWEIRSEYVVPAVRWVIRGLVQSGHLTELEPLSTEAPLTSGVIMTSDVYYNDPACHPFDLLEIRRKKKDEGADESSEDEIEMSEYEKLRAERVSRNAERLRSLGLMD